MIFVEKKGHRFLVDDLSCNHWWTSHFPKWEPETFDIFDRYLTKETTYVDVGAWIGPTVLYASDTCQRCFAIEPDPVAFEQLKMNVLGRQNILPLNHAIFNYDGEMELGCDDPLGNSTTRWGSTDKIFKVKCMTLSTFAQTWGLTSPLFIKMDVEGAEEQILESFDFLRDYRPILYVSFHPQWWKVTRQFQRMLSDLKRLYSDVEHHEKWILLTDQGYSDD